MNSTRTFDQSYPAFLDLNGRRIVVVGGGNVAARKITRLADSGANVHVFASNVADSLARLIQQHGYTHHARQLRDEDLSGVTLVFAASDNQNENNATADAAHKAGCFVNVANTPSASSFLVPSLIDRKPLLVAVSSSGASPVLARILTARIDAFLPQTYSELGKLALRYKERISQHIPDWKQRRRFWEKLLSGRIGELILQGHSDSANTEMESVLEAQDARKSEGEVYLVGAGPGDPDLLSFRALRLMQQCDVVLYDRLVSDAIMALVSASAERIYVGKQRKDHAVPQESINVQLAELALQGKRVLRLKGGDPFMFGRGGEEIETLAAQGVEFQVVPGITAATGCASYAGIPLTHRDYAQACLFVTGHLKDGSVNLDWQALVRPNQTVVIYMGLVGLPVICQKLIEHGLAEDHPIALIAQGTRSNQQVVIGTLQCLPDKISNIDIKPPTLIIVGGVVGLRDKLAWFEPQ
ncbi:MAG: siroheme synthase CysG [Granulosicoccus sp.]